MAHDVFISYPSENKSVAFAICAKMEEKHIRCWIAPRDILPGQNYAEALFDAIGSSSIFILVLSENTNHSPHIISEVQRAFNTNRVLIPFRIEDIEPSKALQYYLGSSHWLDALTPPIEQKIDELVNVVKINLHIPPEPSQGQTIEQRGTKQENAPESTKEKTQKFHRKITISRSLSIRVVAVLLLAAVIISLFFIILNNSQSHQPVQPESFNSSGLTTLVTPSFAATSILKSTTYTNQCNGISFDPAVQSCCFGEIAEGNWYSSNSGCLNEKGDLFCGGKIYPNTSNQINLWCCGGNLWDRSGDDNMGCCNDYSQPDKFKGYDSMVNDGVLFDGTNQHCCNNKIEPGGPWKFWGNCGDTCSNHLTQTCFKEIIYDGPYRSCDDDLLCQSGMRCCNIKDKGPTCLNPATQHCFPYF